MAERYEQITAAQRDVREVYVGGFFGQLVSGAVWLLAAAVGTWVSLDAAAVALWLGGMLIFPVTSACLRASGRPASLPSGHPMVGLAMQVAFTVPAGLLLAILLAQYRPEWFFPASMVVVGAHYLPFVFLYGERLFGVLAAVLAFLGVALVFWDPDVPEASGAWLTGVLLVAFAFLLRASAARRGQATGPDRSGPAGV